MARLHVRDFLNPGPAPDVPPWRMLPPRSVAHWCQASLTTLTNWRQRGTGPAWNQDVSRRVFYLAADVAEWIANENPALRRPADTVIREYLAARDTELAFGLLKLTEPERGRMLRAIARVEEIDKEELNKLCAVIDRQALCGKVLKRPRRLVENPTAILMEGY